jgi:hypothetical protein
MSSLTKRLLAAVCAWEVCVIGYFLVVLALTGTHIWGKDDVVWIAELAICGLFVVGAVALLSCRFGKIGGAIAGVLCGLLPSVLIQRPSAGRRRTSPAAITAARRRPVPRKGLGV